MFNKEKCDHVLESKYLKDVSSALEMETLTVYDADPIVMYETIEKDCDGIKHRVENHMEKAIDKFEKDGTYTDLYQSMKDDFELAKTPDFENAFAYIDEY